MNEAQAIGTFVIQLGIGGIFLYVAYLVYKDAKADREKSLTEAKIDRQQYRDDLAKRDEKFEKIVETYSRDKQEATKSDIELKNTLSDLVGRIDNILRN